MTTGDLNLADPELLVKGNGPPFEMLARWRKEDPVHWNPPPPGYDNPNPQFRMDKGFWVLTRYEDVYDASRKPLLFSSAVGGATIWDLEGSWLEAQRAGMLGMDPPKHVRVKSLVVTPFMPRKIDAFTPEMEAVVRELVDDVASRGECEFVYDIAARLPVYTFCVLMGIPVEQRQRVFEMGNAYADIENPHDMRAIHFEMDALATKLADEKRKAPDETMMSAYANAVVDGKPLSQREITMFFTTIAVAGHETTRNTATHFVRLMAQYPDQRALLLSDIDKYLTNAIHEVLRFSPPVIEFRRTTTEDIELRGKQIKKGDKIYFSYASVNRDEDVFEDPDRFDITRHNADKHLSFGIGQHACLGARLALKQLHLLLKELYTRLPDIEPTEAPDYINSIMFHGLRTMPVRFTPEQR
jgi:cytochrome P450